MRNNALRILGTAGVYAVTLVVCAVAVFFAVIALAGPHGGLLPNSFETPVLIAGWAIVLVVPAWVARRTWRRLGK
jgi:hypothetical protein